MHARKPRPVRPCRRRRRGARDPRRPTLRPDERGEPRERVIPHPPRERAAGTLFTIGHGHRRHDMPRPRATSPRSRSVRSRVPGIVSDGVRLADLLAGLSLISDHGLGLPDDAVRSCLVATALVGSWICPRGGRRRLLRLPVRAHRVPGIRARESPGLGRRCGREPGGAADELRRSEGAVHRVSADAPAGRGGLGASAGHCPPVHEGTGVPEAVRDGLVRGRRPDRPPAGPPARSS